MNLYPSASFSLFLAAVNAAAFAAFFIDKRRAENGGWRIPERRLLALAFYGGSLGALIGQQVCKHKTSKQPFRGKLIAIGSLHLVAALVFLYPGLQTLLSEAIGALLSKWQVFASAS
jgi:uncharacterized membrane protein YsdA (DUF1294 family)